jgi:class 3 adenylate cyclase
MDSGVRYCTSPDGVRIAYKTMGSGRPLVMLVPMPGSIELEMEIAVVRAFYDAILPGRLVIRYDVRGTGASQRGVTDFSITSRTADLSTLVDHLGLGQFDVFAGPGSETHTAITYCAQHPDRTRRLVLWEPTPVCRPRTGPVAEAERVLMQDNWRGSAVVSGVEFVRDWSIEDRRTLRTIYRETIDPTTLFAMWDTVSDVSELLASVATPTLILHARRDKQFSIDDARLVAAQMPDARLVAIEGHHAYFFAWHEQIGPLIQEFLGDEAGPGRTSPDRAPVIRTILFTDLVGHTEMMQRLGDAKGRDVLREHERITRDTLKAHGGAEVKTMGDGFMASFGSVTSAMECAIALQQAFATHTESMPEPLRVRVGLNAGEPIEEDGDLFGATVILASRIAAKAGAGEILVPDTVRGLLSGKGFVFGDRGEFVPKGFDECVRLYEVRWQE